MGWWFFGPADGLVWSLDTLLDKARVASARGGWAEGIWKRIGGMRCWRVVLLWRAAQQQLDYNRKAEEHPAGRRLRVPLKGECSSVRVGPGCSCRMHRALVSCGAGMQGAVQREWCAHRKRAQKRVQRRKGRVLPSGGPVATRTQVSMHAGMSEGSLRACWAGQADEERSGWNWMAVVEPDSCGRHAEQRRARVSPQRARSWGAGGLHQ